MNESLAQFDGRKFAATSSASAEYHTWKTQAIGEVLDEIVGAEYLGVGVWSIDADIDGPGGLNVAGERVAEIKLDLKRDKRYTNGGGPGVVNTIRVEFRSDLLDRTLEETRVLLLVGEKAKRLAYLKAERERLARELDETASKIAEIEAVEIEEAGA